MPKPHKNFIVNVWERTKVTYNRCLNKYQSPLTPVADNIPHPGTLETSSTPLPNEDSLKDSPISLPEQQHGTHHAQYRTPIETFDQPQRSGYDDCDHPLHPTGPSVFDDETAGATPLQRQHKDRRTVDLQAMNNIRHQLKEIRRRRINVHYEKIGMEERSTSVNYKVVEIKEAIVALYTELGLSLSDTQHTDSAPQAEHLQALIRASDRFLTESNKLGLIQKKVLRLDAKLEEAQTYLEHLVDDDRSFTDDNDTPSVIESDHGSSIPEDAYSEVGIMVRNSQDEIESINDFVRGPVFVRSVSTRNLSVHDNDEELPAQGSDIDLTFLDISDRVVQSIGDQFASYEDETGSILPEEYDLSKDNIFVRMKRRRDLASIPELWPLHRSSETTSFDHFFDPDISSLGVGHMVSLWILQYFACSWLEFSRYVFLARMEPAIDQILVSFSYLHLSSLIYANWFSDENLGQPQKAVSMYPTISHDTDNVPEFYHQIFIPEFDDGTGDIEYIQLAAATNQPASTNARPVSNIAQPVYSYRSTLRYSISSRSSKATSHIFDRPERTDTFLTEAEESATKASEQVFDPP